MSSIPKKKIDENEVIEYLTSVIRGESVSEVVVKDSIGRGCSETKVLQKKPDQKERLKAVEILEKKFLCKNDKSKKKTSVIITGGENLED